MSSLSQSREKGLPDTDKGASSVYAAHNVGSSAGRLNSRGSPVDSQLECVTNLFYHEGNVWLTEQFNQGFFYWIYGVVGILSAGVCVEDGAGDPG